jgi:hypothetical protein
MATTATATATAATIATTTPATATLSSQQQLHLVHEFCGLCQDDEATHATILTRYHELQRAVLEQSLWPALAKRLKDDLLWAAMQEDDVKLVREIREHLSPEEWRKSLAQLSSHEQEHVLAMCHADRA